MSLLPEATGPAQKTWDRGRVPCRFRQKRHTEAHSFTGSDSSLLCVLCETCNPRKDERCVFRSIVRSAKAPCRQYLSQGQSRCPRPTDLL